MLYFHTVVYTAAKQPVEHILSKQTVWKPGLSVMQSCGRVGFMYSITSSFLFATCSTYPLSDSVRINT